MVILSPVSKFLAQSRKIERIVHTVAADNSRGMIVLILTQLCNLIQLLCASKQIVNLDAILKRLGADQGQCATFAVQRQLLLAIGIKAHRNLSSERWQATH